MAVTPTGGEASDFKGYLPVMDTDGPAPSARPTRPMVPISFAKI